MSDGQNLIS